MRFHQNIKEYMIFLHYLKIVAMLLSLYAVESILIFLNIIHIFLFQKNCLIECRLLQHSRLKPQIPDIFHLVH